MEEGHVFHVDGALGPFLSPGGTYSDPVRCQGGICYGGLFTDHGPPNRDMVGHC